jgi:hypothetical protein
LGAFFGGAFFVTAVVAGAFVFAGAGASVATGAGAGV